ncbi:MAG: PASTA domain-containing protein [Muribaculaceae bacterium]|jgi:cell division protein FtsI (penicillin-binding protein 3)|nr:PASTA domain-containing protein [Muribaculaceae bacterium]
MKKKSNRKHILFRYGLIVAGILFMSIGIVYKLVDTTVISADEWNKKANKELSRCDTIIPERGNILAADGSILAANLRYYTVRIDFRCERFMEERFRMALDSIADSMARYFPSRTKAQWREHMAKPLAKAKAERPRAYRLINNISYADYRRLRSFPFFSIKNRNRNGLSVESKMKRVNPYGDMARRSIGGVGATAECKEVHGISGLEKALDTLLYGKTGLSKKVPLTKGIYNWTDVPATPGYNIRTTIDIKMQDIVENELNDVLTYCNADWGVAVLMDVATGDIKAISNLEKNPNADNYIEGMNRAVLGYEPGSVVKTISMMIALEDGIVNNLDEVLSTGSSFAYAGGRPITDSHGVGSLTVKEVIERSSNIGMAKIITRKYDSNPGGFYSRLKDIGFLEPMNTGIAGESVPRVDSVPSNRGGRIALSRQCYGYATEIPPLYTLSVYNAIANEGRYVRPRLVSQLIGDGIDSVMPVTYIRDRICSETNAAKMRTMLTNVVWGDHGTGRRLRNDYVRIAGKTGTCYMIEGGAYNTGKKRLAFCGFFPAESPKYSCIVLTCNPKQNAFGAASTSGEVLKNIALKLYSRGMLDNSSDYRAEPARVDPPVIYATANTAKGKKVGKHITSNGTHKSIAHPASASKGVPSVVGYGLRDAIATLERAGYNVDFKGAGYVAAQTPTPGKELAAGTKVTLLLKE